MEELKNNQAIAVPLPPLQSTELTTQAAIDLPAKIVDIEDFEDITNVIEGIETREEVLL